MNITSDTTANKEIDDETLVCQIQEGKGELFNIIADRYFSVIKTKAFSLSITDTEDSIQEGLMGLWSAVQTYDFTKNIKFRTYAFRCIENAILSGIKRNMGKKQIPKGNIVYLDGDDTHFIQDTLPSPEDSIIQQEDYLCMIEKIKCVLSKKELRVLSYYLAGNSYQQIAHIMNCDKKAVDNAIQRIRKKLKK